MQTWDGTTSLPPRSTPVHLPLTVTTRFSQDRWVAEVRLITQQDDSGSSGYTLWTYMQAHDPADGAADLTEQVRERAVGQFANRLAHLLSAGDTTATDQWRSASRPATLASCQARGCVRSL